MKQIYMIIVESCKYKISFKPLAASPKLFVRFFSLLIRVSQLAAYSSQLAAITFSQISCKPQAVCPILFIVNKGFSACSL